MKEEKQRIKCFVSCSFDNNDKEVLEFFKEFLIARGMEPCIENRPSPKSPPEKVRLAIRNTDCLVAILTQKYELKDGTWKVSDWINNEIGQAYALEKPIIAFVEKDVKVNGILPYITTYVGFKRENLTQKYNEFNKAITMLSEAISEKNKVIENIKKLDTELIPFLRNLKQLFEERGILKKVDDVNYFYELGIDIIKKSKTVRFAGKTPVLILPQERATAKRAEYYETLIEYIKQQRITAKYIFSYPTTYRNLINYSKKSERERFETLSSLHAVLEIINYPNLELKHSPSDDFISCIIGDSEMIYLWKSPIEKRSIAVIHEMGKYNVQEFKGYFDKMFSKAETFNQDCIKRWIEEVKNTICS